MEKNYLFVLGAPRSGTTAIANLINTMENVHIGIELFPQVVQVNERVALTAADFEADSLRTHLARKFAPGAAEQHLAQFASHPVNGDKHPLYHRILPELDTAFPECGFVFIFRDVIDVARSFQRRFDNPDDGWGIKGFMAINYWCEAADNFLSYQEQHPEKCTSVYFKHMFADALEGNITQAHRLRDRLAQTWGVGAFQTARLESIMQKSATLKSENSWSEDDLTEDIFQQYARDCPRPIWTITQYRDMHARLITLDLKPS